MNIFTWVIRLLSLTCVAGAACTGNDGGTGGDVHGDGGSEGDGGSAGIGGEDLTAPSTAGISDCVEDFIDADGACRPSLAKCPLASVPDVDVGCVPVGVTSCAADFTDARGLCMIDAGVCPAGSFPVPTEGCVPIDGPSGCGTGTWGNVAAAEGDVYVDLDYPGADSNGSAGKPFTTLSAGLSAVAPGKRVILAAGIYTADLTITDSVEVRGVCASKVTLTSPEGAGSVVALHGAGGQTITLSDLTVSAPGVGVRVEAGDARLTRVVVRDVSNFAIGAAGESTTLTIDHCLVRDTLPGGSSATGTGILALGGSVKVEHSAVVHAQGIGLQAAGGSLEADDVFVADTVPDGGGYGHGAVSQQGGELTLRNAVLRDNPYDLTAYAAVSVEHSVFGAPTSPTGDHVAHVAGNLTMKTSAIVDGETWGLTTYEGAGALAVEHLLVSDLASGPYGGSGLSLAEGGSIKASALARISGTSLTLLKSGTLTGIVVEDAKFDPSAGYGTGIVLVDAQDVVVDRSYVRNVADAGVALGTFQEPKPGKFTLTRSRIEELPGVDGSLGIGVVLLSPKSTVTVEETVIEHVHAAGVMSVETPFAMSRTIVRDVAIGEANRLVDGMPTVGPIADGILFLAGSSDDSMALTDVWIEGAEIACVAASGGTHTSSRVHGSGSQIGVALRDGATLTAADCDFSDNATPLEDPSDVIIP